MSAEVKGVYARIYHCVVAIPKGRVATYGQIAQLTGASGARQVGYALACTPRELTIPWHRVINAKGMISLRSDGCADSEQQQRLLAEGIIPDARGRIDLRKYLWQPAFEDLLDEEEDQPWPDLPGVG